MTRLTITVPEEVALELKTESRRRRISVSELVRERIEGSFCREEASGILLPFIGIGASKVPWSIVEDEEDLAALWEQDLRESLVSQP